MKTLLIFFITLLVMSDLSAQINVTPFAGINTTRMTSSTYDGLEKGGSFGFGGIEIEWKKKTDKHHRFFLSALSGITYLKNGFYRSYNFSLGDFYYMHSVTSMQMKYWQIPIVLRFNFQPFTLQDELHIFIGAGVSNNILIHSNLSEENTKSTIYTTSIFPPPQTVHSEDSRDITSLRNKNNLFQRFEIGMKYKRVQVAFRISKSLKDLYCIGLENSWNVPDEDSQYISAHNEHGKISEVFTEFTIGFRVLK